MVQALTKLPESEREVLGKEMPCMASTIRQIEAMAIAKVEDKFKRVEAEDRVKSDWLKDCKHWTQVADYQLFKQQVYLARAKWVDEVVEANLCSVEMALKLSKLKFKL